MKNNKFSIKQRIKSFGYAFSGITHFFSTEHNGWIHTVGAIIAISTGIFLDIHLEDWLWITIGIFIVFITEFINSSIERIVDLVTDKKHELAKQAKDLAAAAVLLGAISSIIIALIVFGKYL